METWNKHWKDFLFIIYCQLTLLDRDAWVAQSIECLTSAQVMISQFVGSSPVWGFVLTVQSLLQILRLCLFLPFSYSLLKMNKHLKKIKKKKE